MNNKHYGILFNRKSGEIIKTIECLMGKAMLTLYALQGNIKSGEDFVIFRAEDGVIIEYFMGKRNDFPKNCKDMKGKNINDICEGLLEALN